MRAAIYIRVSTTEQATEGYSLAAQTQRLRAYCESQDWSIIDIYADEGVSAKDTERPELQRLMADVEKKIVDVVLVWRLDRLTRSVLDLHEMLRTFDKYNVGFKSSTEVFDTTTAIGRLFITIVGAMAQWERENIGERVSFGMAQKAMEGKRVTAVAPFGYIKDGDSLKPHPQQAPIVKEMFHRFVSGNGIHRLRLWLRSVHEGASAWDHHTIAYILDNPVYIGKLRWGHRSGRNNSETIIVDGDHEPLIDEETWKTVQSIRERRTTTSPRSGTGLFPLSGIIFCSKCGGRMIGHHGNKYLYYRCSNYVIKECDARMIRADAIESGVVEFLRGLEDIPSPTPIPNISPTLTHGRDIEKERAMLKLRKKRLWDAYELSGNLDELRERLERIRDEETALDSADGDFVQVDDTTWRIKVAHLVKKLVDGWEHHDNLGKKELLRAIIERVDAERDSFSITLRQM